ncbi:MAG: hypothetical protein ACR2QC_03270 [Gammaproteobacteria bacterium]
MILRTISISFRASFGGGGDSGGGIRTPRGEMRRAGGNSAKKRPNGAKK